MLISGVINGWGNNAEGLAINRQLDAKKKRCTIPICLALWWSWMERYPCHYPHAVSAPYYGVRNLTAATDIDYNLHTQPPGMLFEPAFTSS
jgi:hypothetical protein